jgi:hypothetical protein
VTITIKPIIKCESQRSCKPVGTRPSLSGDQEKCFLDFYSLDKIPEFAYENTSFDYEFVSQSHDYWPKSFESNEGVPSAGWRIRDIPDCASSPKTHKYNTENEKWNQIKSSRAISKSCAIPGCPWRLAAMMPCW